MLNLRQRMVFPERDYQLRFRTRLPDRVFTKDKLVGEGGAIISVVLIDAITDRKVTSRPESSVKLQVVVLDSGFDKDEQDSWDPEDFQRHVVPEGKGPALEGNLNLQVRLREGVAELGKLSFDINSSKMSNERVKIGVKVAPGSQGNTRIREGITNAIRVLERRGKGYQKHYPPALEDEVWRLEKIAKDGLRHLTLRDVGISKVKDFLLQLSTDPEKLKEILRMDKRYEDWKILVDHATTCETNWQHFLYHADGEGESGAVFDSNGQLIGLIKSRVYVAACLLSAEDRDLGHAIVNMALARCNDVWALNGKTLSGSMQQKSSSSSSSHVLDGFAPGTSAARVGQEAPPANVGSAAEESEIICSGNATGLAVGESALATHQPEFADRSNFPISRGGNGLTTAQFPMQSEDTSSQYATGSQWINTSSQRDCTLNVHVPPSELPSATISGFPSSSALPESEGNPLMEGTESTPFDWETLKDWDGQDLMAALESPDPPGVHTSISTPPSG